MRLEYGTILIRFPNEEAKDRALELLLGEYAFKSWRSGDLLLPEEALPLLTSLSLDDWIVSTERLARSFHVELTPFETTARAMLMGMRAPGQN